MILITPAGKVGAEADVGAATWAFRPPSTRLCEASPPSCSLKLGDSRSGAERRRQRREGGRRARREDHRQSTSQGYGSRPGPCDGREQVKRFGAGGDRT